MKQSENKVAKETCKVLLDDALAGCDIKRNAVVGRMSATGFQAKFARM